MSSAMKDTEIASNMIAMSRVSSNPTHTPSEGDDINGADFPSSQPSASPELDTIAELAQQKDRDYTHMALGERILEYLVIAVEGDLAGFQIAWLLMSITFLILKVLNAHSTVAGISWWAIFVIPISNALLTGWFDFIIRKYRSANTEESLQRPRFLILWGLKCVAGTYVATYWMWGEASFMERYRGTWEFEANPIACTGQVVIVYIAFLAAVLMSEMMISTVLINSEQNLSYTRVPMGYRVVLLIIRPFVWVYNRTMVMFLCFYALYGLAYSVFVIAIVADSVCESRRCAETQQVGLRMLLVPFTEPDYLSWVDRVFSSWNNVSDDDFLEAFVIIFLCQSFYVDCLNSLWQFSRRWLPTISASKNPESRRWLPSISRSTNPELTMHGSNRNQQEFFQTLSQELPVSEQSQAQTKRDSDTVALK